MNRLLARAFGARRPSRAVSLPFGISILLVAHVAEPAPGP